jgi:hypothetical protein
MHWIQVGKCYKLWHDVSSWGVASRLRLGYFRTRRWLSISKLSLERVVSLQGGWSPQSLQGGCIVSFFRAVVVSSGRMVSSFGWCREVMSDVLEVLDVKSGIRQGRDCRMELMSYEREKHGVGVWVQLEREKNKT